MKILLILIMEFSGISLGFGCWMNGPLPGPRPLQAWPESEAGLFVRLAEDTSWHLFSASKLRMSGRTIPLAGNWLGPEWHSDFVICSVIAHVLAKAKQELIGVGSLGGSVHSVCAMDGPGTIQAMGGDSEGLGRHSAFTSMSSPCC